MKRRTALKNTALLGGSALLSTSLLSLLQSCKEQSRLDWEPRFLNANHANLISSLVDTILPKTDTPGGLDVKVDLFIDLVFDKLYDEAGQKKVLAEMEQFNTKCRSKYGKLFHELDLDQKKALLEAEEANAPKFNRGVWGVAVGEQEPVGFYRSLKSLMLWGYFTSEEIGKNVLNYDPVPGKFVGCIPLSDVGNIWSL